MKSVVVGLVGVLFTTGCLFEDTDSQRDELVEDGPCGDTGGDGSVPDSGDAGFEAGDPYYGGPASGNAPSDFGDGGFDAGDPYDEGH